MTKTQIKAAADRVQDLLLDLVTSDSVRFTGQERDDISSIRDLCSEIADGNRWEESEGGSER